MSEALRTRDEMILCFKNRPFYPLDPKDRSPPRYSNQFLLGLAALPFNATFDFLQLTVTCKLLGGLRVTSEAAQQALAHRIVAGASLTATTNFGTIKQHVPKAMKEEL